MEYAQVLPAEFLARPNRFVARCRLGGEEVTAHVPNTGRCRELLVPGCTVYLAPAGSPRRRTRFTLVCVDKAGTLINIDSLAPNRVFREAVEAGRLLLPGLGPITRLRPETVFDRSRFDFYLESGPHRAFAEIKGVTLEENGVARFPDAPTERGLKHVRETGCAVAEGYLAYLVFIVQMKGAGRLCPNWQTQPAFGEALRQAREQGVHLLAFDCAVAPGAIALAGPVPLDLSRPPMG